MNAYVTNTTLSDIAGRLRAARRVVITTHAKPDGDAIGSTLALGRALERLGVESQIWYMPPLLPVFAPVIDRTPVHVASDGALPDIEPDVIVILDTGARSQLKILHDWLDERGDRICIVDHHLQGDDLGGCRYVEPAAAAASELTAQLIDALGVPLDRAIAEPLYLGIATDTGWFRFSNVRRQTFELAARLLGAGVDHSALYRQIEQTDRVSRFKLLARALESMELVAGGRVAVLTLRYSDYVECGASTDESHGFSDIPQSIGTVEVVCLIAEPEPGVIKVSLRSKQGPNAVDVNQIAKQFEGGGHARASGARIEGRMEVVRPRVILALDRI